MLLIKTTIGPSKIHGTGLFAAEFIPKDTVWWKFVPTVDHAYTPQEAQDLPEPKRSEVLSLYYAYISKQTGRYIDSGDNTKYINHSIDPNTSVKYIDGVDEDIGYTLRDIQKGEEMTIDYASFAAEGANF